MQSRFSQLVFDPIRKLIQTIQETQPSGDTQMAKAVYFNQIAQLFPTIIAAFKMLWETRSGEFLDVLDDSERLTWTNNADADVVLGEIMRLEPDLTSSATVKMVSHEDVARAIHQLERVHDAYQRLSNTFVVREQITQNAILALAAEHRARLDQLVKDMLALAREHDEKTWTDNAKLNSLARRGITEVEMAREIITRQVIHFRLPVESATTQHRVRMSENSMRRFHVLIDNIRRLAVDAAPYPSDDQWMLVINDLRALAISNTDVVSAARLEAKKIAEGRKSNVYEQDVLPDSKKNKKGKATDKVFIMAKPKMMQLPALSSDVNLNSM